MANASTGQGEDDGPQPEQSSGRLPRNLKSLLSPRIMTGHRGDHPESAAKVDAVESSGPGGVPGRLAEPAE